MTPEDLFRNLQALHQAVASNPLSQAADWENLKAKYSLALSKMPDHPVALFGLGTLFMQLGDSGLAIALLNRCMEKGGKGASPWINLGAAWKVDHNDDEAAKCYHKAIEAAETDEFITEEQKLLDMNHAYHGMASLYINAGQPDLCIHWCNKALKIKPDDRYALWNKGLALLERGDWEEGFRLYDEAGFRTDGNKPMERKRKTYGGLPKWEGEPGKTVICYGEQGVGDEIMFASMLPDLMKEAKVILDVDKRIPQLLRRSFPEAVAVYDTSSIDDPFPWIKNHEGDDLCYFPMGSLGKRYRKRASDFPKTPYLVADPVRVERWRNLLEAFKGLKVGISWAGGLKKTRADMRSMRLKEWRDILSIPGAHFFSLQYHKEAADEVAEVGRGLNIPIMHYGDMIEDWEERSAFVTELDLIITVNTSLHHLVGGLGVKQWCLTPKYVAWRYGQTGDSPWYGNCKMYRQKKPGEWKPVLDKVAHDLRNLVTVKNLEAA
jgi:tetratricopeptide (TPR) repeat protein